MHGILEGGLRETFGLLSKDLSTPFHLMSLQHEVKCDDDSSLSAVTLAQLFVYKLTAGYW